MGMFADTRIIDYRSSFANQGKQTLIFRSRLQQTTEVCFFCFPFAVNKGKLLFSVSSDFRILYTVYRTYAAVSMHIHICCPFKPKMVNRIPGDFP
jgi:hypothetical protein